MKVCCSQGISNKVLAAKINIAFGADKTPGSTNSLIGKLEGLVAGKLLVVDKFASLALRLSPWQDHGVLWRRKTKPASCA